MRERGADLGSEGDFKRIWPREVVLGESMCRGELMRLLGGKMELQVGHSMVLRGEWMRGEGEKCRRWSGEAEPGTWNAVFRVRVIESKQRTSKVLTLSSH